MLEDNCSSPWLLTYGVLYVSFVARTLNIYIKLLDEIVRGYGLRCHQNYDDCAQLYPIRSLGGYGNPDNSILLGEHVGQAEAKS